MNNFPDELQDFWVKKIPEQIQFVYNKVFDEKNQLELFNTEFPRPYGEYVLLSRKHEYELFLKFNYAKYRASKVTKGYNKKVWLTRAAYLKEIIAYHNICLAFKWTNKLKLLEMPGVIVDPEEIEDDTLYALNRAIDKFDTDRNFRFSTFASKVIMSEVYTNFRLVKNRKLHSLDFTIDGEIIEDNFIDNSTFGESDRVEACIDAKEMVLDNRDLNKNERFVLIELFGLNSRPSRFLWEVSKKMGISKQRVHQIRTKGLEKIREKFTKSMISPDF